MDRNSTKLILAGALLFSLGVLVYFSFSGRKGKKSGAQFKTVAFPPKAGDKIRIITQDGSGAIGNNQSTVISRPDSQNISQLLQLTFASKIQDVPQLAEMPFEGFVFQAYQGSNYYMNVTEANPILNFEKFDVAPTFDINLQNNSGATLQTIWIAVAADDSKNLFYILNTDSMTKMLSVMANGELTYLDDVGSATKWKFVV